MQSDEELPQVVHLLSGVHVIKLLSLEQLRELASAFQVREPQCPQHIYGLRASDI